MTALPAEWTAHLQTSRDNWLLAQQAAQARRLSAQHLWLGAKAAIRAWDYDADPTGDGLYADVLAALGGAKRKASASKVRTVALACAQLDLDPEAYGSLNMAYGQARRMAEGRETDR